MDSGVGAHTFCGGGAQIRGGYAQIWGWDVCYVEVVSPVCLLIFAGWACTDSWIWEWDT